MPKVQKNEIVEKSSTEEKPNKKETYSSVCKEFSLSVQDLKDLLTQIYDELEKDSQNEEDEENTE